MARNIQDILDEHTDQLPEALYIKLSNAAMKVHNRQFDRSAQSIFNELHSEILTLQVELQREAGRASTLRRLLDEARSGVELSKLREELEVRKKVNADTVAMYKGQITAQCLKIVEYKAKIKELTEKLASVKENVKEETTPTQRKPPNPWIMHVKVWSLEHNTTYVKALKDPLCKEAYQALKRETRTSVS